MTYLLGTDEAGYGPNLGPLVIACSVWHVPDPPPKKSVKNGTAGAVPPDLYELLSKTVCRKREAADDCRLPIADSKQLYSPGTGLSGLELGVLAALAAINKPCGDDADLWHALDRTSHDCRAELPWQQTAATPLPCDALAKELAAVVELLQRELNRTQVKLCNLQSRAVFPARFNRLVEQHGNKATALSNTTLDLVAEQLAQIDQGPIVVICDKHGGRNKYASLLMDLAGGALIETVCEGRDESIYRFGPRERRVEFRFRAGGEDFLPSALASMAAKYLREIAMRSFNEYWNGHLPDLKPTAGYPGDARRYFDAIRPLCEQLGIAETLVWRCR